MNSVSRFVIVEVKEWTNSGWNHIYGGCAVMAADYDRLMGKFLEAREGEREAWEIAAINLENIGIEIKKNEELKVEIENLRAKIDEQS